MSGNVNAIVTPDRVPTAWLFGFFFVSGFCGLLYQVVWLRMAFAAFGVITPVLSVVISVFMLGLSLGSWIAGRWVERLTQSSGHPAILFYAAAEAMIGVGAFAVPVLFESGALLLLPIGEMNSSGYLGLSGLVLTASILPWCFFMGTTFPLMAAHMSENGLAERTGFSFLYLANVLGATLGVLLTALVLIEVFGFSLTLRVAGFSNFAIALLAVALHRGLLSVPRPGDSPAERLRADSVEPRPVHEDLGKAKIYSILFATGFVSMAMEVVWTRAFTPMLTTTIYAFASLLAAYLIATFIGTSFYRVKVRSQSPIRSVDLLCALCVVSVLPIVMIDPRISISPFGVLASIMPLCAVLGALTPKLIDDFSRGEADAVGRSYGVNIVGSILGPLCAAYLLLPIMEVKWILVLLGLPFFGFALLELRARSGSRGHWASLLVALGLLLASAFGSTSFADPRFFRVGEVRRDHTATVVASGREEQRLLRVNGMGLTRPTPVTKMMAHFPMASHAGEPERVLVLCFGMGTTLRAAASWGSEVTAVELIPSVVESFPFFFPDAREVLNDPRVEIVVDDARRYLKRGTSRFDIVTIDPPPPIEAAGSSLLYSYEFYETLQQRMAPGAILQQWFPYGDRPTFEAMAHSLKRSFPHVRAFRGLDGWGVHFLASTAPLPSRSGAELLARIPARARIDLAEWLKDKNLERVMTWTLRSELPLERILPKRDVPYLSDDRPINEYYLMRRLLGEPDKYDVGKAATR